MFEVKCLVLYCQDKQKYYKYSNKLLLIETSCRLSLDKLSKYHGTRICAQCDVTRS